jgi:hypothetical protein
LKKKVGQGNRRKPGLTRGGRSDRGDLSAVIHHDQGLTSQHSVKGRAHVAFEIWQGNGTHGGKLSARFGWVNRPTGMSLKNLSGDLFC